MNPRFSLVALVVCCLVDVLGASVVLADADVSSSARPATTLWAPEPDTVYLQEIGRKIPTDRPVTSVAALGKTVFAVQDGKVYLVTDGTLSALEGAPDEALRMRSLDGAMWVATSHGAFRFDGSGWKSVGEGLFKDFCLHLGRVHAATSRELFIFRNGKFQSVRPEGGHLSNDTTVTMEDYTQVLTDPVEIGPIDRIASYSGTLYLPGPGSLSLLEGRTFIQNPIDWGQLPSRNCHDMLPIGSRLFVATDRGLAVLRGMSMTTVRGPDGLPYEGTTCLCRGIANDLWIGTSRGAIRYTGEKFHYFGADHWLPGEMVNDICVGNNTAYVASDKGLGIISYEPFTLQKKARYFEEQLATRGFNRLGFIHKLYWSEEKKEWLREIIDNDGGNTAPYLAAMSFKFAVTGSSEARAEALDAFKVLIWLDDITPTEGFIARAVWSTTGDPGERSTSGSGGLSAKWYPTPDGKWLWKGDTSSDEVNAHFYAVSIFHDLAAQGPEKDRATKHLANIARHIPDNGWVLRDTDGKPTRWGRWDPDYLQRLMGSMLVA